MALDLPNTLADNKESQQQTPFGILSKKAEEELQR